MRKPVQRVAAIHDISGFGRVSMTVVIPVLSTMGIQVCPLPTSVLSTHTGGFENYKFIDLTNYMDDYIKHWKSLGIEFDCIYSGYLGSSKQIGIISNFINDFTTDGQLIVIDPVMGDNGGLYKSMDLQMVEEMRRFIRLADIITPNLTEAAFLLDEEYKESIDNGEVKDWLRRLSEKGPKIVVITSVPDVRFKEWTYVVAYNREDNRYWKIKCDYVPAHYPGTGDIFTSVLVGSILQGDSLPIAMDRSVQFITAAVRASYGHSYPEREGVLLERVLSSLTAPVMPGSYQILE